MKYTRWFPSLYRVFFALIAVGLTTPTYAQVADLVFEQGWIRGMPPGSPMSAAYGVLINRSKADRTVVKVAVEGFAKSEIHRSMSHEGMVHMVHQPKLTIAAGQALELAPGGYHLMLMHPQGPLRPGEKRIISFTWDNAVTTQVEATIKKQADDTTGMHHHH